MKSTWIVITGLVLGTVCAVTAGISVHAREAAPPPGSWEEVSTLMANTFGADWYDKMQCSYTTNYAQFRLMKRAYCFEIGRK